MSLMSSLTALLEADNDWSTLMSDRLHPVVATSDETSPWASYKLVKDGRDYAVDGPAELHMADILFTLESASYLEVHHVATLLSNALDGYRGATGDIVVYHIRFMDSRDGESKDEVLGLFSVICEVSVWYKNA